MKRRYVVAVDMDNTIADLQSAVLKKLHNLKKKYPEKVNHVLDVIETKYKDQKSPEFPAEVEAFIKKKVMASKDFFYNLNVYPGAVDALKEMEASGQFVILFLTSPLSWKYGLCFVFFFFYETTSNNNDKQTGHHSCLQDKVRWVGKHFGMEWTDKVIISKYKDLVQCDFLVDDLPEPNQFTVREPKLSKHVDLFKKKPFPSWTHVLFTQPYNEFIKDKPRITQWKDWRKTFTPLIE